LHRNLVFPSRCPSKLGGRQQGHLYPPSCS
jgi:hypothetical protein